MVTRVVYQTIRKRVCRRLRKPGYADGYLDIEHQVGCQKVQAFVTNPEEAATFSCGSSRNFAKFIDLFDNLFVLESTWTP